MRLAPLVRTWLATGALALGGCAGERASERPPYASGAQEADPASPPSAGSGVFQVGVASYYANSLAGHKTANGERYDPNLFTAAHRKLPFGTIVEVRRKDGRTVRVRINDRGPFVSHRVIDLSRRAAGEIGLLRDGMATVELRVVSAAPAGQNGRHAP